MKAYISQRLTNIRFFILTVLVLCSATSPLKAQYYFGRNKIQYNQFNWQVLKTPHFDIYFYPEMRQLAEIGAAFAEESYKLLEDRFDHSINRRIPLIFYSSHTHFQETNVVPYLIPESVGGFFEFLKGRVVIPFNGSIHNFKMVIRHELVHVFTHSKFNRIMKDHARSEWSGLPLWFVEGLAEYWSTGWDSQAEMVVRDAVINNYFVPLSQIYRISGTFLMYKEGQAVLRYIAAKYGEDKIIQLIENAWKADRFTEVFRLTLGKDYKTFDEEWLYHLKKEKYPLLKSHDIPRMVTQRITEEGINTKPAYYKKGDRPYVVFVSNRMGYSNIYWQPLDKSDRRKKRRKPEVLIKGERTSEFEAFHILRSKIDVHPSGLLTFTSKSGDRDAIYVYDLNQKRVLQKLKFPGLVYLSSPSWSPDASRIVFSAVNFAGENDLYIVELSSGKLQRLTRDFYDDRDPVFSPDGRWIAFSSDRTQAGKEGYYNLFLYDLRTGQIEYLTYGSHNDYAPVWSPDGQFLAFTSDRGGAFNIWVIRRGWCQRRPQVYLASSPGPGANSSAPRSLDQTPSRGGGSSDGDPEPYYAAIEVAQEASPFVIVEPTQLKKVTHFVTGAFDPEWTADGGILFTSFENFSFQIRKISGVPELFEKEKALPLDRLASKGPKWSVKGISGQLTTSTIKYRRKFDIDVAQSQITQDPIFGTSGGAQVAISDMLGNEQYYFLLYNTANSKEDFFKSFNVAVTRLDLTRRTNYAYGLYHFAGMFFNYYEGFFYERLYGGFVAISYPLSLFKRIEGSLNIRNSDKDWYGFGRRRKALLISNFLSFVKDNSLWGPTGPIDGERFNLTIGNTVDVRYSNVNFYTLIVDYRRYFRLSGRVTFAVRLMGRFNEGRETRKFFLGGSWDLRGYRRWSIWGEKLLLINQELRFPFIDNLAIRFPFGGLALTSIRGASFVDVGNAWDGSLRELLGSVGVGIRFHLGGFLVLRLDYGKKFHIPYDRGPRSITFEPGTFKQFFFGWDF